MSGCPPMVEWEALVRGARGGEAGAALEGHARVCGPCAEALALVRSNEQLLGPLKTALRGRLEAPSAAPLGRRFGRYSVRRLLGAGGMGAVYEAEQDHPRRTVALKVMSRGLAPSALRRFEREGELLGRLHHPGIAQIFEAGTDDDGSGARPFIAMELVRGRALLAHARERVLAVRDRLDLFARVCDAVQHAHDNGVVHRDLKPSNILVDEHGQPKVLDFGVARVTDHDVKTATLQTDAGQIIGTIAYMSPEQALGRVEAIDARSDVYALGVILYELLAGRAPYDISGLPLPDAVRAIREQEPTALGSVDRSLRGDLETIVGMAVEKEAARRYQSAAALAADVRRYLADQPIAARPPSTVYQLRKFARRNRLLVGGVTATFGALLLGLAGTSYGILVARRQAEAARLAQQQAEDRRVEADRRRAAAETVTGLLAGMLKSANPHEVKGAGYTVRQLLDDFSRDLGDRLAGQPEADAAVRSTIGNAYRLLGEYTRAGPYLEAALAGHRAVYGGDHPLVAASLGDSAWLLHDRADYPGAVTLFRRAVEIQRAAAPGSELAVALMGLSDSLRHLGSFDEAEPLARESLALRTAHLGEAHPDTAESLVNLGKLLRDMGRTKDAEPLVLRALDVWRAVYGPEHPRLVDAMNDLAWLQFLRRDIGAAEETARGAAEMGERVLGPAHPDFANALYGLALIKESDGKAPESRAMMERALAIYREAHGNEHPSVCTALDALARILKAQKQHDRAESVAREALALRRTVVGDPSVEVALSLDSLAGILRAKGDYAGAERAWEEALAMYGALGQGQKRFAATTRSNLAQMLAERGELDRAEQHFAEAMRIQRAVLGPDHADTLFAEASLARLYLRRNEARTAEPLLAHCVSAGRSQPPKWRLGTFLVSQGQCLRALERFAEAEAAIQEGHEILQSALGPSHAQTVTALRELAALYEAWGKPEEAQRARAALPQARGD